MTEIPAEHQARDLIIGSVAAQLYGVDVQLGNFDIVPALEFENLIHLA